MNGNSVIYQLDGLLRTGFHHAFERHRISRAELYVYVHHFIFETGNSPNHALLVPCFGNLGTTSVVDWREDVERGENTCDGETQHPKREMTPGANPVGQLRQWIIMRGHSYLLPEPKTLASGSLADGSIFPSLFRNLVGSYMCGSGYTLSS